MEGVMRDMMQACMKKCRWCPIIPLIFGVVLFLPGYFLNAETVRILWLVFSCIPIFMGLMALIMMNTMFKE